MLLSIVRQIIREVLAKNAVIARAMTALTRLPGTMAYADVTCDTGVELSEHDGNELEHAAVSSVSRVTNVEIANLDHRQGWVVRGKIRQMLQYDGDLNKNDGLPLVALRHGRMIVLDGHHRITCEFLKGARTVTVELFEI